MKVKLSCFILATQVKFLSTYLKVGFGFILVTEIQVMIVIIEDTKKVIYQDQTSVFTLVTET
jgi:hypothetical protein